MCTASGQEPAKKLQETDGGTRTQSGTDHASSGTAPAEDMKILSTGLDFLFRLFFAMAPRFKPTPSASERHRVTDSIKVRIPNETRSTKKHKFHSLVKSGVTFLSTNFKIICNSSPSQLDISCHLPSVDLVLYSFSFRPSSVCPFSTSTKSRMRKSCRHDELASCCPRSPQKSNSPKKKQ